MLNSTAADNDEDLSLLSKPVDLYAQCNEKGSEVLLLTGELVVVDTFRKKRSSEALSRPAQCLKRVQHLPQGNTSDAESACFI